MTNKDNRANPGWTLVGMINFVALLLILVIATGYRPSGAQILGGAAIFFAIVTFLVWMMVRKR
jgi:hypothetical protein